MLLYYNFVTYYNYKYYFCLTYLKQIFHMKKILLLLISVVTYSNFLFADAGTFEYYLDTKYNGTPKTHGDYGGGTNFDGSSLATAVNLNSDVLIIDLPGLKTWQNADNGGSNVSSAEMMYRIYKQGTTPGSFISQPLGFIAQNGNDKEWNNGADINLLTGLTTTGTYVVEVYFTGAGTGAGTPVYRSNSGNNYKATFVVATPLPITLSNLSIRNTNNQNQLSWTTETEKNGSLFEIEKSVNGKSWAKLGEVTAKGNTTRRENYSFMDKNPSATNYYRLKMVDRDGSYEYSKIVSANNGKSTVMNLFPNPVQERLNLNIESQDINEVNIQVINMNGQVVLVSKNTIGRSNTPISIDANELQSGIYFIKITDENANVIGKEKFLKQ